jgi:heat shock protein HslJ
VPTLTWFRAGLAIVLVGASLAACGTVAPEVKDREFLSVAVTENGVPRALVAGTRISLRFGDDEVGAHAGCNQLGGSYRIDLGRLLYDATHQTAMGCDEGAHAQDAWLVEFLSTDPTVRIAGAELTLDNGATVIRLLDREVAEPDVNIVGPTWAVESIIQGDTVSSVPAGARATLVFKADGTVDVEAGCNRGGGRWTLEGGGIRIDELGLTKMACQGPGGALEGAVLGVLGSGTLQARIDANVLTLSAGNAGLQLRG